MIVSLLLPWLMAAFALALLLNVWRLLRGPSLPDRILALDTLYVNALALVVLLGLQGLTKAYFEVALLIGLLGFVGTVVLSKVLLRGDIAE